MGTYLVGTYICCHFTYTLVTSPGGSEEQVLLLPFIENVAQS